MPYDPIRDCNVPLISPEQSRRSVSGQIEVDEDSARRAQSQGRGDERRSSAHSTPGGGLRGLLNEEPGSRRSSGQDHEQRSSISSTATSFHDDTHQSRRATSHTPGTRSSLVENPILYPYNVTPAPAPRQSITRILNESTAATLSKSDSAHSSSPSDPSPGARHHHLEQGGFLTPGTPASANPRGSVGSVVMQSGRSGYSSVSPGSGSALPPGVYEQMLYEQQQQQLQHQHQEQQMALHHDQMRELGLATRPSSGSRPMLPPQDMPPPAGSGYDYARGAIGGLPRRSPSISVSPRVQYNGLPPAYPAGLPPRPSPSTSMSPHSYQQSLPQYPIQSRGTPSPQTSITGLPHGHSYSRPTSSASNSQSFSFQPPLPYHISPTSTDRRLSDDRNFSRPPSGTSQSQGRRSTVPSRRPSILIPQPKPYAPNRLSAPTSVLIPYNPQEIPIRKQLGQANNPLRRKLRKSTKPLPSWSGPSPGGKQTPDESDSSYFPNQGEGSGRGNPRAPGVGVSAGSGFGEGRAGYPPGFEDKGGVDHAGPSEGRIRQTSGNGHANGDGYGPGTGTGPSNGNAQDQGHLKRSSAEDQGGRDSTRHKVSETKYIGNAGTVASHYNARPEVGKENREFSPIIGLKKFNNWIKSVLIGKFAFRPRSGEAGANVLDIGCGKGGDLMKWKQAWIGLYVGIDIAAMSIDQARERHSTMRGPGPRFDAFFFAHDCYARPIGEILYPNLQVPNLYNNVSMQFCMHYAFESASKVRMMLENVSRYLRPGGIFTGTIPSAELLLERLNALPEDDEELKFGNSCYYVQFNERRHKGVYGHQYSFYLEDAVEGVPEYLVDWDNFVQLASEYRLNVIYKKTFSEILAEEQSSRDFGPLLVKMGVLDERGQSGMDEDQWEAANLYMGFAFERID